MTDFRIFTEKEPKELSGLTITYIGDATYTDMHGDGLYNIGQLAREAYGDDQVMLTGGSYQGSVIAGSSRGAESQIMSLPKAKKNSREDFCHEAGQQFYLRSSDLLSSPDFLDYTPHRGVGVVYNPDMESYGNCVPNVIPKRYDAFLFFDRSDSLNA